MDQPRGRNMRLVALGTVLIALTAGYLLLLRNFNVPELPSERHFGAADPVVPAGEVYLEPISIDALNDAMQVRAYLSPSLSESKNAQIASDRDLTLLVSHDNTEEEVKLAAGDHIASSTFEVDLNEGSVTQYPLDSLCGAGRRSAPGRKVLTQAPCQGHDVGGGARLQPPYHKSGGTRSE
jgi:Domain of unknown function (DUF4436)